MPMLGNLTEGVDCMPYNHQNIGNARRLRREMTPWERKLWYCFLKAYPVRFQRQKLIGNYIVDFYCASAKLAVELDGSGHYTPEEQERDTYRMQELGANGVKVIRFCNLNIDRNFYEVCTVIDENVKKHNRRGTPPGTP